MKLFSKEKGFVFSALNAILLIWMIASAITIVSNLSYLLIKDNFYTYEEYKLVYCDMDYYTEEECERDFAGYELDTKSWDNEYKRDIIISLGNLIIIGGVMYLINKEKTNEPKKKEKQA